MISLGLRLTISDRPLSTCTLIEIGVYKHTNDLLPSACSDWLLY